MAKKKIAKKTVSKKGVSVGVNVKNVASSKASIKQQYKVAPLSNSFAIISIVGIIISAFLISRSPSWGFAFLVVFVIMFIASLRSMRYGPIGRI